MLDAVQIEGKCNYNKPRQAFADTIAGLNDADFVKRAETTIWLSVFANNNRRSDYHWQADVCSDEATRRGKPELYTQAYDQAVATCG